MKYTLDDDALRAYMKLTVEEKLTWLEQTRQFNRDVFTKKEHELRRKLVNEKSLDQ